MMEDPYKMLEIHRGASGEEIRRAYFKLVRRYTPEEHPEEFKRIRQAYDALKTPEKRLEADLFVLDTGIAAFDLARLGVTGEFKIQVDAVGDLLHLAEERSDLRRREFHEDLSEPRLLAVS